MLGWRGGPTGSLIKTNQASNALQPNETEIKVACHIWSIIFTASCNTGKFIKSHRLQPYSPNWSRVEIKDYGLLNPRRPRPSLWQILPVIGRIGDNYLIFTIGWLNNLLSLPTQSVMSSVRAGRVSLIDCAWLGASASTKHCPHTLEYRGELGWPLHDHWVCERHFPTRQLKKVENSLIKASLDNWFSFISAKALKLHARGGREVGTNFCQLICPRPVCSPVDMELGRILITLPFLSQIFIAPHMFSSTPSLRDQHFSSCMTDTFTHNVLMRKTEKFQS